MSFQPIVPFGGYAGWQFLNRTADLQRAAFEKSPLIKNDTDHFLAKIGTITSPKQLVEDPRMLKVALGAFGLSERSDAKYLIEKVLTEGPSEPNALANRLSDKRFLSLAKAFDFTAQPLAMANPQFGATIVAAYREQGYQRAVGAQDATLQAAMKIESDLPNLAGTDSSESAKWYSILGTPSLRAVFGTALGLPSGIVSIDIDKQVEMFRERTKSQFGSASISQFATPEARDKLVKAFLARSQLNSGAQSLALSPAAQLISGGPVGPIAAGNALAANMSVLFS